MRIQKQQYTISSNSRINLLGILVLNVVCGKSSIFFSHPQRLGKLGGSSLGSTGPFQTLSINFCIGCFLFNSNHFDLLFSLPSSSSILSMSVLEKFCSCIDSVTRCCPSQSLETPGSVASHVVLALSSKCTPIQFNAKWSISHKSNTG
ncbi:hypothetical protein P301_I10711 [Saccharomyces cerevisiae P301]|uniref:Putative uncharacterized membrane protein YIL066W-A n=2 Tax=Saccharomyces cerevisiae TaxID=4932 RepID=YI066_YEAST|nr:RecName: Full=Putative uncharacterized membrane protein YIL066W-A [Saccharomyces cerevisiae S288C]pir/S53574/ probable membrane protein YIL066w-a - yeast (Saccharomyces cerevisiae) [Saccharomyces cerevisiae]EWG90499.1 hypothetical protein P301_I10711 [Saccharomyces cerevisiae P301]EWG95472.1 hypothetical protein R103_I10736 [Saccharomyces cerevisiae R103]WHM58809.1 hypothetical protein OQL93_108 [Saccharomyces cerevisiae synthetic construct]CAY80444.1 EC1118_1I12_1222p [Saccharomyces cerevi